MKNLREILSIVVIILAIITTFKNTCGLGKYVEGMGTFAGSNVERRDYRTIAKFVLPELFPNDFKHSADSGVTSSSATAATDTVATATPGAGAADTGADTGAKTGAKTDADTGAKTDADTGAKTDADTGAKTDADTENEGNDPQAFTLMEGYTSMSEKPECRKPTSRPALSGSNGYTPKAWNGNCLNYEMESNGEALSKLCRGTPRGLLRYNSDACPRKWIVKKGGSVKEHLAYIDRCASEAGYDNTLCYEVGKYALIELNNAKSDQFKTGITKEEIKSIGRDFVNLYVIYHEMNSGRTDEQTNKFKWKGAGTNVYTNLLEDTRTKLDNMLNKDMRKWRKKQGWSSWLVDGSVPDSGDDYADYKKWKRATRRRSKLQRVCNAISGKRSPISTVAGLYDGETPQSYTNTRTTNQFNSCNIDGRYIGGSESYGPNDEGGTYMNIDGIYSSDEQGKYPRDPEEDPKAYNSLLDLF